MLSANSQDRSDNLRDDHGGEMSPRAVRKARLLVLALALSASSVGMYLLAYFRFPSYSADAYIECISPVPKSGYGETSEREISQEAFLRFVKGQELLVKQPAVLGLVLQDPYVQQTTWYREVHPDKRIAELERALSVGMIQDTPYVRVAMSTHDPNDPHKIVNTVVERYLGYVREQSTSPYREELSHVRREYEQMTKLVQAKDQDIRGTIAANEYALAQTLSEAHAGDALVDRLLDASAKAEQVRKRVEDLRGLLDTYEGADPPLLTAEDAAELERDPEIARLDGQVRLIAAELDASRHLGADSRQVQDLSKRRDEAQRQLETVRSERRAEYLTEKERSIRDALALAEADFEQARQHQSSLAPQLLNYVDQRAVLLRLHEERDRLAAERQRIEDNLRELEGIVLEGQAVRVRAAVTAQPPLERSFPALSMLPYVIFWPVVLLPLIKLVWVVIVWIFRWTAGITPPMT